MTENAILMVGESYNNSNLFYKTRFLSSIPFVYLSYKEMTIIVTPSAIWEQAKMEAQVSNVYSFSEFNYVKKIKIAGHKDLAFLLMLKEILDHFKITELTVPKDFPVFFANGLIKLGINIHIDCNLFVKERSIKNNQEILYIKETQSALEKGMKCAEDIIRQSIVKDDLLFYEGKVLLGSKLKKEIEITLLKEDCNLQDIIIACGKNSSDPHYHGDCDLKANEAIMIDIFPYSKRNRYYADMTRTFTKGNSHPQIHKMYKSVLKAQKRAIENVKDGVPANVIFQVACNSFKEDGFTTLQDQKPTEPMLTKGFLHSIGHGIGLNIHESPFLFSQEIKLNAGNIITVEPGLYDPDYGGIRIEDIVLVKEDGCEILTQYHNNFVID
ncbi:MAG: Xaa-Pro peptidase family protein [Spirochaetota bacterium]|nr:Xaa-Pro peptidase family protein [Spirochaetota bacterium]